MNVPDLPENLARWPSDPFELLGVERGVAPRDLKRVYTRLIKIFKPEHHPEHFRRIREAYENVLRFIEFFGGFEIDASPIETPPAPAETTEPKPPLPPNSDAGTRIDAPAARIVDINEVEPPSFEGERPSIEVEPRIDPQARVVDPEPIVDPQPRIADIRPARRDDLTSFWDLALNGEEEAAYRGLKRLHDERPQVAVALRLYWLLSVDSALDPHRNPCQWLIDGLLTGGLHGPCMELYRREVEADPEEAFSDRFEKIMRLEAPTGVLAEVLSWRWQAIRKTRRWSVLEGDLDFARERIGRLDEGSWLRLLLAACDGTAWIREGEPSADLWDLVQSEIGKLQHLGHRHSEWFDRLELLVSIRRDWQKFRRSIDIPTDFLDLIADAWHAPYPSFQRAMVEILAAMVDQPAMWLNRFDRIAADGLALLHAFAELLRQMESQLEDPTPKPLPPAIEHLARTFMRGLKSYPSDFRQRVVTFCFREGIDPAWMIEPLLNHEFGWYSNADPQRFVQLIEDWPVRYLCQAHRLFWMGG